MGGRARGANVTGQRMRVGAVAAAQAVLGIIGVTACGSPAASAPGSPTAGGSASSVAASAGAPADGDPNAAGRDAAAATRSASAPPPDAGSAGAAICANETLADSMARAVQAGSSVVLATGGFTGSTSVGDGEIGVPFSEVALTVEDTLAGPDQPSTLSGWVYGDLGADGQTAVTGEASSLWARGGRMIAVVDGSGAAGLPGPVLRVAPVIGDDVIFSWVGCWSTNGVESRDYEGSVDIFDDRGLHPADLQLQAVRLADFRAQLPE